MTTIRFREEDYSCEPGETVLACLLRHGVDAPSSCRSGVCQTCMMRAVQGRPPEAAQAGLKETLKARGYFLACICEPDEDLEVVLSGEDVLHHIPAVVTGKQSLTPEIVRLCMRPEEPFSYRPGQFINLRRPEDGLTRSYSLASLPQQGDEIELHVRALPEGRMSQWLVHDLEAGGRIEIEGPHGECFYTASDPGQPLLMVATGTGLAPLWGILRDALDQGHEGPIHLFHGSYTPAGLYLVDELRALADEAANFSYHPCADCVEDEDGGIMAGRVHELALRAISDLQGWRIYLCGHPGMVEATKKAAFLAGASLSDIYSDPFVYSS